MEVHTSTTLGYKETVGYCGQVLVVIKQKYTEILEEYQYTEGDFSCDYLKEGEFQPNGYSTPIELEPDVYIDDDIFINSSDGLISPDCSFSSDDLSPSCMIVTPNFSYVRYDIFSYILKTYFIYTICDFI